MSLTLNDIQHMAPEEVREFVREVGIAWENGHISQHSSWEIGAVLACHGTMISTAMARAFMAQPELREKPRIRGSRR